MFKYKLFDKFLTNEDFQAVTNLNLGEISDTGKRFFIIEFIKMVISSLHVLIKKR